MKGGAARPAGWWQSGILLLLWLLPPGLALAQSGAAPVAGKPDGQTATGPASDATDDSGKNILDLDIDQLAKTQVVVPSMDIPVTSVTKEPSTVGRSAAAVFVITNEMIRRSGAKCIPEALRMAPGLQVAQITADKWAISARGFNGLFANKLLVLIDGRSVYNLTSGGVYWDVQDTLLEDVDRIEVIRGPGGTMWGANAVNGVISIITKSAKDTHGAYLSAGGGTQEHLTDGARYGGQIAEDFHYRVYAKQYDRGGGAAADNFPAPLLSGGGGSVFSPPSGYDTSHQDRAGFRADWDVDARAGDKLTVQGDCYDGSSGALNQLVTTQPPYMKQFSGGEPVTGQNILVRWQHTYDEDSDWTLQTYYDRYTRNGLTLLEMAENVDLDFQYRFPLTDRQEIICGLGNAVKFTASGGIRLVATLVQDDRVRPLLSIQVIDTGIGMTNDQVGQLFQRFNQLDNSTTRKYGGTGLGLAISKRLAEMLGGDIVVRSEPEKGSSFTVTIETAPLEAVPQDGRVPVIVDTQSQKTIMRFASGEQILLADDSVDNQRLLSHILTNTGFRVTVAENGQVACDRAMAAVGAGMPFDLILMDMQMPVMDGYEATRRLRSAGYTHPIVALTAHAASEDRKICLDAGCDYYVTKPIDRDELMKVATECLGGAGKPCSPSQTMNNALVVNTSHT